MRRLFVAVHPLRLDGSAAQPSALRVRGTTWVCPWTPTVLSMPETALDCVPFCCSCHSFNVAAQANQLRRAVAYKIETDPNGAAEVEALTRQFGVLGVCLGASAVGRRPILSAINKSTAAATHPLRAVAAHPAGPFTIHFWAPSSKWALSGVVQIWPSCLNTVFRWSLT